jgi:hypothetical protein
MMAFAAAQLPLSAALLAADGALLRATWLHVAFFAVSVQREKLLAAADTLPLFAAAMHASHAAAGLGGGGGGFVPPVLGGVAVLLVSTGGTVVLGCGVVSAPVGVGGVVGWVVGMVGSITV